MRELQDGIRRLIIAEIIAEAPKRPLLRVLFWQSIEIDVMIDELVSSSREYLTGKKEQAK